MKFLSRVRLFATPWTVDCQAPLTIGFSRQGYWSALPFPSPRGLPDPEIEPQTPTLQGVSLPFEPPGRHYFVNKGLSSQGYGFSSGHVWM